MKTNLLVLALTALLLGSCVPSTFMQSCGGDITKVTGSYPGTIKYESYGCLVRKTKEEAVTEMWTKDKLDSELTYIPKGGQVVYFYQSPIMNVDYEIIVKAGQNEITRNRENGMASGYSSGSAYNGIYIPGSYTGVVVCPINEVVSGMLNLFVIDKIASNRTDFNLVVYGAQQ